MAPTLEDLTLVEQRLNLTIKPEQRDDYLALITATDNAAKAVMDMPVDFAPLVDYGRFPRTDIYILANEINPRRGWAYKATVRGAPEGLLKGKTICLKDNICLAGVPCQFGTDVVKDFIPEVDATIVSRVLENGGTILGKATCENMSHGAASFTSPNGPVQNPYADGFSAGGSSSGCGTLIGKGEVDMGLGGDQGGSVRIPAAFCGVVGLKATFGLVPYTGVLSSERSLDHVGPMAATVKDAALLLQAVAGYDGLDDRQLGAPSYDNLPLYIPTSHDLSGLRIGILTEGFTSVHMSPEVEQVVRSAIAKFKDLGAEIKEVSVPTHSQGGSLMHVINKMGSHQTRQGRAVGARGLCVNGFLEKLLPWEQSKWDEVHSFVQGTSVSGEYAFQHYPTVYGRAMNIMRRVKADYDKALSEVDVLAMPTVPFTARRHVESGAGPLACVEKCAGTVINTATFNGTGHPALAFPVGFGSPTKEDVLTPEDNAIRLPISMQIVGRMWEDAMCIKVAAAWEDTWNWKTGQRKI
ncbi:amidase signature enzyme [Armillaria luteobubalina]|uniref:Amidase signature enzyme n=1 Tax=Armillaria luteobubalina TaxID=153913 RepID=A0AA39Q9Q6_9AGAR|nr:amidase signature enzyme [Armillaria luteobubalina]